MAKYNSGAFGGLSGKIGNVVYASWMGIPYVKRKPRKTNIPPSKAQIEQRAKFKVMSKFIGSLGNSLTDSFYNLSGKMTGRNSAFRINYSNVITGTYPAYTIEYSKVLVCRGQLFNVANANVKATGNSIIHFNWTDNSGIPMANPNDKSVLIVYCQELNQVVYTTEGANRSACAHDINAGTFAGKTVQTWLSFISANKKDFATSIYTGQLVVV